MGGTKWKLKRVLHKDFFKSSKSFFKIDVCFWQRQLPFQCVNIFSNFESPFWKLELKKNKRAKIKKIVWNSIFSFIRDTFRNLFRPQKLLEKRHLLSFPFVRTWVVEINTSRLLGCKFLETESVVLKVVFRETW